MPVTDEPPYGVITFRELEGQDGAPARTLSFRNAVLSPLGYDDLAQARLDKPLTIPVEWRDGEIVSADFGTYGEDARIQCNATMQSPFTSQAISLVRGGWLPSGMSLIGADQTILIDRNIVTQIEGRFSEGAVKGRGQDFLDLFADKPIRINPLLYVMEGAHRRRPSRIELEEQLDKVVAKLRAALPEAILMVGPQSLDGVQGLLDERQEATRRNGDFLRQVAADLASPVSARRLPGLWDQVVEAADRHGVHRGSLTFLAVLSSLAVPGGASPARAILKFSDAYSEGDIYNALTDLRALELYCALLAIIPDEPMQLCTGDKALALFWSALNASDFSCLAGSVRFSLSPSAALLPESAFTKWRALVSS